MAAISFYIQNGTISINNTSGSGLGFFGSAGYGASVLVGQYQDNTYVTNGNGTTQGPLCSNIKYTHPNSGIVDTATSGSPVINIPNANATLNIRFTNSTAVRVQNAIARIYNRSDTSQGASGVTTQVYETIHVNPLLTVAGSGATSWHQINAGVASSILLANSPGTNGNNAGNGAIPLASQTPSTQHDWYLCLSASPDSIGSKTLYGLYVSLEYL